MADSVVTNENFMLILGIVGGLVLICLSAFNPTIGPLLAALGAVCAILWGANAISRVASYGLGTGVPSIGYMSLGGGVISSLAGLVIAHKYLTKFLGGLSAEFIGPVIALVIGLFIGLIIAVIAKKLIGMKIPVMIRCTAELGGAAALSLIGFSVAIAGSLDLGVILNTVVLSGIIGLLFILNTMAIQHPYNACLGPNEDPVRTFKCACHTAFISMIIVGICSILTLHYVALPIIVVGLICWIISFRSFIKASYDAASEVKWSGLWPEVEQ